MQAGAQDIRIDGLTQLTVLRRKVLEIGRRDVAYQRSIEPGARDLENERVDRRIGRICRRAVRRWIGDGAVGRYDRARRRRDELTVVRGEIGQEADVRQIRLVHDRQF